MSLYYFIFVWLAAMAIAAQKIDFTYETNVLGYTVRRWKLIYAVLVFVPVIYLVAFTAPRSDTVLYMKIYKEFPSSWAELLKKLTSDNSGKGFSVFQWVIKNISGGRESIYRLTLALLHSIPVLYIYRKYSENFILSTFLFLATGCHIAWMMNGLRQFLAVSLIVAATPMMIKKKYTPLILVIILATTIHSSAILMLPVVFIVQGKTWNHKTLFFIVLSIIMMYVFSKYTNLMDTMLEETEYAGLMENAVKMGDDGTNPIRVLVNSIPMLLALVGKRQIARENDVVINLCVNMSVITVGIYLISMVTSGIMIGRLPIYTSLYSYILLPYLVKNIFTQRSVKVVSVAMVGLYFAYYLYSYRGF